MRFVAGSTVMEFWGKKQKVQRPMTQMNFKGCFGFDQNLSSRTQEVQCLLLYSYPGLQQNFSSITLFSPGFEVFQMGNIIWRQGYEIVCNNNFQFCYQMNQSRLFKVFPIWENVSQSGLPYPGVTIHLLKDMIRIS